jgi:DoxX-like family
MSLRMTETPRHARDWSSIRPIAFWVTTFVIVFELAAGSVWNLLTIEWIEVQMLHLGYPHYFAYISGWWQAAAAAAIIVPGLPLLKEWAYAGAFFLWSGAVASHLSAGDGFETWSAPLMFTAVGIASWALRPADRRLPGTRLRRDGTDLPGTRPRGWVMAVGLLVVLYVVSLLTLPVVEDVMHEQAVELGWIDG